MKKKSIGWNIFAVVVLTVLLVAYLVIDGGYMIDSTPQNINEMIEENGEPVKGEYVSVGVDAVLDWYAETEHRINGIIPVGTDMHCLVWLDDNSFISLTVKGNKNIEKIEKIIDETYAYMCYETDYLPTPVVFKGRISTIDSEVSRYYEDALNAWGISVSSDAGLTIYRLDIDTTQTKLKAWLMFLFIVVLDAMSIMLLVSEVKHNKKTL